MNFKIRNILDSQLCLGCGLCENISGKAKMIVNQKGFLVPEPIFMPTQIQSEFLNRVCPAINIDCVRADKTPFGTIEGIFEGWASNADVRFHASSGGVISALCIHLLKTKRVDAILQVRKSEGHYMINEFHVSRTEDEVKECAASRYAPVAMFKNISMILNGPEKCYAFVGKPCDVMTMRRYVRVKPELKNKIKYYISLVCAGTPSYNATQELIARGKRSDDIEPVHVKYRGDGWPGEFKVTYNDNSDFSCGYNESWGMVLGRRLNFRCKICPDGVGQYADIVVGDSWSTPSGYPDFSEQDGRSLILARTNEGQSLISSAIEDGAIECHHLELDQLIKIQPYQYQRLLYAPYKLVAAQICTHGLLKIKNLKFNLSTLFKGLRSMVGTIKRYKK